ncbi:MAG: hypothetical protein PHT07_14930 [Paludibacter sp.]|nr:hypothetical protein [Paludibacter sp.]
MEVKQRLMGQAFWDEIKKRWPGEFELFDQWLEKYKEKIGWSYLCSNDYYWMPDAMQIGIFYQYTIDENHRYALVIPEFQTLEGIADDIKEWFCQETDDAYQDHLHAKYDEEANPDFNE